MITCVSGYDSPSYRNRRQRLVELRKQYPSFTASRDVLDGRRYIGTLPTGAKLSAEDLAILCDGADVPFGAKVQIEGQRFWVTVWSD